MNRLIFAIPLLLVSSLNLLAQNPTGGKPATTPPVSRLPIAPPASDTIVQNRLVALALNGPEYDATYHQNKIDELRLKQAKSTWLNLLTISTQLNDQSFKQPTVGAGQVAYVYPKYYFGVTIPLGIIFSQGNTVKQAKESLLLSRDQQQMLAAQIKANVLSKYRQYRNWDDMITMEAELLNDVLAISTQAEQNFKNGGITVDAYISAQRMKNEEMVKLKNLQLAQDLVRYDLERMIGVPLDDVLHLRVAAPEAPLYRNGNN